jgi:hypothetical protein
MDPALAIAVAFLGRLRLSDAFLHGSLAQRRAACSIANAMQPESPEAAVFVTAGHKKDRPKGGP